MPFFVTQRKKVTIYESKKNWYDFKTSPLEGFLRRKRWKQRKRDE
jgi:hypothetical protein